MTEMLLLLCCFVVVWLHFPVFQLVEGINNTYMKPCRGVLLLAIY